jgi:hypothetical protein
MAKTKKLKTEKPVFKSLILPSDFNEMDAYFKNNKATVTQHVVNSIEYALKNNLDTVEIFSFSGSDYNILISKKTFEKDLDNIYNYYIQTEKYEFCSKIIELKEKLNNSTDINKTDGSNSNRSVVVKKNNKDDVIITYEL